MIRNHTYQTVRSPEFELLEPRLLLGGIAELSVFMGIDYDEPDQGGKEYQVWVDVEGTDLLGLKAVPPWSANANDAFDSDDFLHTSGYDWDGASYFEFDDSGTELWFEGDDTFFQLGQGALTVAEWNSIRNGGDFQFTVYYVGGSWTGTVDFSSVSVVTQEPVLTNPVHGQTGVPLTADVQWEPFQYSSIIDDKIHIQLVDETADQDVEDTLLPADATSWTPSALLKPNREYQIGLAFAETAVVPVNGLDVLVVALTESDHYFVTSSAGPEEIWVDRGNDQNNPGAGDEELSYYIEVGGKALDGLEVTTPWGETFDSDDTGWAGGDYDWSDSGVYFEAYTEDGLLWLEVEWQELTGTEWDQLESDNGTLTVEHAGGTWTALVNFDGVPMPSQVPELIAPGPVHGQSDVSLNPTFHWGQWVAPDTADAGTWWELEEELTGDLVYEEDRAPADTTSWATSQLLEVDTQYHFAVDFHNIGSEVVDGVNVTVTSWHESDILFTTTDTPMYKKTLTPGGKTGKWTFKDADGDDVTVIFTGRQGTAEVTRMVPEGGQDDILDIRLIGTNSKNSLAIKTKGKAETTIGSINVLGSLNSLDAKTADIHGDVIVDGTIGKVQLGDLRNGADIILLGTGATKGVTLKLGTLYPGSDIVLGSPLKSLSATQWVGSSLTAPWASSIAIKGDRRKGIAGDFGADLTFTGADPKKGVALGKLSVAGTITDSVITANFGSVGTIMAAQWDSGSLQALWAKNIMTKGNRRVPSITGDFGAALNLTGQDSRGMSLNKLQVAGKIVGPEFNPLDPSYQINLAGGVGTIMAAQWDSGSLQALWAKNIMTKGNRRVPSITGDFGASLTLTGQDKRGMSLNKLQVAGTVVNSQITLSGAAGTIKAASWASGSIIADSVKSIKTSGDRRSGDPGNFLADLNLAGKHVAPGRSTLGNVSIAGNLGKDTAATLFWDITGDAGAVRVRGDIWNWDLDLNSSLKSLKAGLINNAWLDVDDTIGSVQAVAWDGGSLAADSVKSIKLTGDRKTDQAGDLINVAIKLSGENVDHTRGMTLGSLSLRGWAEDSLIEVMGNVGKVDATALLGTNLLLGCSAMTGSIADFESALGVYNEFTLKSLTLKGDAPDDPAKATIYFQDKSIVAAWNIDMLKFNQEPSSVDGSVQFHELAKATNVLTTGGFLIQV